MEAYREKECFDRYECEWAILNLMGFWIFNLIFAILILLTTDIELSDSLFSRGCLSKHTGTSILVLTIGLFFNLTSISFSPVFKGLSTIAFFINDSAVHLYRHSYHLLYDFPLTLKNYTALFLVSATLKIHPNTKCKEDNCDGAEALYQQCIRLPHQSMRWQRQDCSLPLQTHYWFISSFIVFTAFSETPTVSIFTL